MGIALGISCAHGLSAIAIETAKMPGSLWADLNSSEINDSCVYRKPGVSRRHADDGDKVQPIGNVFGDERSHGGLPLHVTTFTDGC